MRTIFKESFFREDFQRIKFIFHCTFGLMLLTFGYEWLVLDGRLVLFLAKSLVFMLLWRFLKKAIKNFYYSFWFCSILINLYFGSRILFSFREHDGIVLLLLNLTILVSFLYVNYLLSSPLYYPHVKWWIFDFRKTQNLKIRLSDQGDVALYEGRLTDLRRNAGSLVCFRQFQIPTTITLYFDEAGHKFKLSGEVLSIREHLVGRGFVYGIRFALDSLDAQFNYQLIKKKWKS